MKDEAKCSEFYQLTLALMTQQRARRSHLPPRGEGRRHIEGLGVGITAGRTDRWGARVRRRDEAQESRV
jgi:hypothetical protein